MKKNLLPYTFILLPFCFVALTFGKDKYRESQVEPGTVWVTVSNEGNPFEKHDTTFYTVLDVKSGFVLVLRNHGDYSDTSSNSVRFLAGLAQKVK